jgi:hypothetical protein
MEKKRKLKKKIKGKKKEPTQKQSQKQIININIPTPKKTTRRKTAMSNPIQQPSRVFMVNAPPQPFPIQPISTQQPFIEPIKQPSLKENDDMEFRGQPIGPINEPMTTPMRPMTPMEEPKQRKTRSDKGKSRDGLKKI